MKSFFFPLFLPIFLQNRFKLTIPIHPCCPYSPRFTVEISLIHALNVIGFLLNVPNIWQSSMSSALHPLLSVTIVINIYLTLILNVNMKCIPGFALPSPQYFKFVMHN